MYSKVPEFKIPVGRSGDCYDRYLIRVLEMYESLKIIKSCLALLDSGLVAPAGTKKSEMLSHMEGIIQHFKFYSAGEILPKGTFYTSIEAPKGEFGVFLITTDKSKPYRCKIRSPGFFHLQGLNFLGTGHLLADIVTIIGSIDIVFGEIDR